MFNVKIAAALLPVALAVALAAALAVASLALTPAAKRDDDIIGLRPVT